MATARNDEAASARPGGRNGDAGRGQRFTVRRRPVTAMPCVLIAFATLLAGCGSAPVQIVPEPPKPPRVDCQQQPTPDVPPWPVLWWLDGPAYTIEVLGILTQERGLRGLEQGCIDGLKAKGVIR